jgi:uncharacterized integral membrane protein
VLSFLRESDKPDGTPGPLSARRISAVLCFLTAIVTAILAIVAIIQFIGLNPTTTIDWKSFIPLFIPCIAFLFGGLLLLFFTTWNDITGIVNAVKDLKKG